VTDRTTGYAATAKLERELALRGTVHLEGLRYRATVAQAGATYFEAWTDTLPFVYGRPSTTLEGALDNLETAVREAERRRQAS
jgi:hypothetical protein